MSYFNNDFSIDYKREEKMYSGNFFLHNHDDTFEILLFIKGKAVFSVEGTLYTMNEYDIIIAQSCEMHRMHVDPDFQYERYVINIKNDFFLRNDCNGYKDLFVKRKLGENNQIPGDKVRELGLENLIKRIYEYAGDKKDEMKAANAALIELLYNLNKLTIKNTDGDLHEQRIKDIILFINHHISENITLEEIATQFFITKCHLCRMFKKYTGYTVNNYITFKRILLAKEYHREGKTWSAASEDAGFGDYANFYKHFKKIYGYSPREVE